VRHLHTNRCLLEGDYVLVQEKKLFLSFFFLFFLVSFFLFFLVAMRPPFVRRLVELIQKVSTKTLRLPSLGLL